MAALNEPLSIAYNHKDGLRQIWQQPNQRTAQRMLKRWLARASEIPMHIQFADTLEEHQQGILAY